MYRISIIILFQILIFSIPSEVDSARILGVFPMPSISHQVVFRAYSLELAKRGHELVIITPNPALPKVRPPDNITEIDVGHSYKYLEKLFEEGKGLMKRGVISDISLGWTHPMIAMTHMVIQQFEDPDIKRLIEEEQSFDLIVAEAFLDYPLILSHIFKAPVIWFSSLYGTAENYEAVGAVSRHLRLHPHMFRNKFRDLSFSETLKEIYTEYSFMRDYVEVEMEVNKLLQQRFGPEVPTVAELKNNVELLFVNVHPMLDNNRPVPPNVIYLGALQLQRVKELPQDLKEYLDNSKRGVVYVSLGTNVRPSQMDKEFLDVYLDTFEALPYDVLWKFDGENLDRVSKNVKIQKWFPQRDLLQHPNIKVFVTQGGLQSTDEAIDGGVPLVGIPILGDQWYNVNKYVDLGIGEMLDPLTVTSHQLLKAIDTVIKNDRRNIVKLRELMNDQPMQPLQRAVWWTEHVLRHGGARHLRAPAANMSWSEYLMLDIVLPFTVVLFTATVIIVISLFYLLTRFLNLIRSNAKLKVS